MSGSQTAGTVASAIRPPNSMALRDALVVYSNPEPQSDKVVTLIKPPIVFSKNSYSTPLTMPLGLAYLAAVLEKARYRVKIIDCPGGDVENIRLTPDGRFKVQGLEESASIGQIDSATDIIGITIMFSQEWPFIREYINRIRQRFPRALIIVGGEHPTAMPEYTLRDCPAIDYLVLGEGELTLLELVYRLRSGKPAGGVLGVARRIDGEYQTNDLSPRLADIREMPWPAWHLIDVEPYFRPTFSMGIGCGRNMAMLATRGCPYQCTFCSSTGMWTTRYVLRPVTDVVDEIQEYIRRYDVKSIDFYDLTAVVKRQWILDFVAELERRRIGIVWQIPAGTRSESLDEEVVRGLARTGCKFVAYAPESGSQCTLDKIKKRVHLKNLEKSVSTALRYGVVIKVNFIIGFPFETRKDILKSVLFLWKLAWLKADDCNVSPFSPYPGSEMFDELARNGVLGQVNDSYFENLMTQFDFTVVKSYCRNVGSLEIMLYRVAGMSVFYGLSYLRMPSRLIRLVKFMFRKGLFEPRSLFEQRVYDMAVRRKRGTRPAVKKAAGENVAVPGVG